MNLTARQFKHDSIFSQSMAEFSMRKSRHLASTGFSNSNKSMHSQRLPQLQRSFSSGKSTKLKLTTIEGTLSSIDQQVQQLRLETRQSRRYCNFLKDDLGQNHLGSVKLDLLTQANKLEKMFKLSKKHDQQRTKGLKKDCDKLRESSQYLKNLIQQAKSKLDKCQNFMGIYSGKEKHKV